MQVSLQEDQLEVAASELLAAQVADSALREQWQQQQSVAAMSWQSQQLPGPKLCSRRRCPSLQESCIYAGGISLTAIMGALA